MKNILDKIKNLAIIPVVKITNKEQAIPLAKALIEGDLPVAEITFRSEHAVSAIKNISKELPEIFVGAGTVLTITQVDEAIAAGAKFIVAPGFNRKIVEYCLSKKIPVFPGANNPSFIEEALELGLEVVKFFPAEQSGGTAMLQALSAPYDKISYIPTGGINEQNIKNYLQLKCVVACGGSWMVTPKLLEEHKYNEITSLSKKAVLKTLGLEFSGVGINEQQDIKNTTKTISFLAELLGIENSQKLPVKIVDQSSKKENNYLAFKTLSINRTLAYLEKKNIKELENSRQVDKNGKIVSTELDWKIGSFNLRLEKY